MISTTQKPTLQKVQVSDTRKISYVLRCGIDEPVTTQVLYIPTAEGLIPSVEVVLVPLTHQAGPQILQPLQ